MKNKKGREVIEMSTLTGYKLGKLVNVALEGEGLKTIPTTQIYRYFAQGLIPTVTVDGQRVVNEDDATAWITKYVARRVAKASAAVVVEVAEPVSA
jgi:hypothetical protein